jgi:hypothetical protein
MHAYSEDRQRMPGGRNKPEDPLQAQADPDGGRFSDEDVNHA